MFRKPMQMTHNLQIPNELFSNYWDASITEILEKFLLYVEQNQSPTLAMLPKGVSPVGLAILASLKFLPSMPKAPIPFCRIALYPGSRFYNQLRSFSLPSVPIIQTARNARAMLLGDLKLNGSIEFLEQKLDSYQSVHFHWLWKCNKISERYGRIIQSEISPRSRFGSRDLYRKEAVIDLIDTENPSLNYECYDLFIYCPYYHSGTAGRRDEFRRIADQVKKVKAHRTIILSKSPFDFWSRRIESEWKISGMALSVVSSQAQKKENRPLSIKIIDQLINFSDAVMLYRELIRRKARFELLSDHEQMTWKLLVRRFFNSMSPIAVDENLESEADKFKALAMAIGLTEDLKCNEILASIDYKLRNGIGESKLDHLVREDFDVQSELWVTKDADQRVLVEKFSELGKPISIFLCNRRFLPEREGRSVILTRVENDSDLNWVSYLGPNDKLIISAWEAAALAHTIDRAWERSLIWRDNSDKNLSLILNSGLNKEFEDSVFLLADNLLTALENVAAVEKIQTIDEDKDEDKFWWQDDGSLDRNEPVGDLLELKSVEGPKAECIEVHFSGGQGTFFRLGTTVPVIRLRSDAEFESINVSDIENGDIVLFFKDGERESLFDLLMDQLAESEDWKEDVKNIRFWKASLKTNFYLNHKKINVLLKSLEANGLKVDAVVARSWIFGGTMAPINLERTKSLAKAVGVTDLDISIVFQSVKKVRNISIQMGRILNQILIQGKAGELDDTQIDLIEKIGLDLDEIKSAVNVFEVKFVSTATFELPEASVRKLFVVK